MLALVGIGLTNDVHCAERLMPNAFPEEQKVPEEVTSAKDAPTDLGTITAAPFFTYDAEKSLARIRKELDCSSCIVANHGKLPLYIDIPLAIGAALAKQFLPQPRIRGEPMDEALYYSLQRCVPDGITCMGAHPNAALYNWEPDDNQSLEDDPNAFLP